MPRVLITSKSCSTGRGKRFVVESLATAGIETVFSPLSGQSDALGSFQGVVVGMDRFGAKYFAQAASLRFVLKYGVGIENIDTAAAKRHGVAVLNLPRVNDDAVAEMALALMLAAGRRVAEGDRLVRSGQWPRLNGRQMTGATLGIIGTGAIGCKLARLSSGFGMSVIGTDVAEAPEFIALGGRYVSLDDLLQHSDFISIHVPLTDATRHLIGQREFSLMEWEAVLVNTSRGAVVDEEALCYALKSGGIFAAGLDVFETEPSAGRPVTLLDRVVSTPHIAAATQQTIEKMDDWCVAAIIDALTADPASSQIGVQPVGGWDY